MTVAGIFVGGSSRRMGGRPKGLLPAPGGAETIAARLVRIAREAGLEVVLIGDAAPYASLGVPALRDDPQGIGPLGGLAALLAHADPAPAIALACDMPGVTVDLLRRLDAAPGDVIAAREAPSPAGVPGHWQPFFAKYRPSFVRPILRDAIAAGERSFQALFAHLHPTELVLDAEAWRALADWDVPGDVTR